MAKKSDAKKRTGAVKKSAPKRPRRTAAKSRAPEALAANRAAKARRQIHQKALNVYERALDALQRGRFSTATSLFHRVIKEFPEERELHERCRRYIEACDRVATPAARPETLEERLYAATIALNAGAWQEALAHLEVAETQDPDSDHVQYMLAVAQAAVGQTSTAISHLHRAIELNPDNRFLARHESSFETLQENRSFQQALDARSDSD